MDREGSKAAAVIVALIAGVFVSKALGAADGLALAIGFLLAGATAIYAFRSGS